MRPENGPNTHGSPVEGDPMTDAVLIGLALVVAVLGFLVLGLLRSHAEVLRTLSDHGVDVREPAASDLPFPQARAGSAPVDGPGAFVDAFDLTGETPYREPVALSVTRAGGHTLIAFLSSQCLTCQLFWNELSAGGGAQLPNGCEVVVVTKDPDVEVSAQVADLAGDQLEVVMSSQAWRDYEVPVSPYFVHILDGRVVGTGAASRWDQIVGLVDTSLRGGLRLSGRDRRTAGPEASETRAAAVSTGQQGGRISPRSAQDRSDAVDAELRAAGILPGDARLWPTKTGE
jgi:hypothetical protein